MERYHATDSIEHDFNYIAKHWKTILALCGYLTGGAIFYYRLSVALEKVEAQDRKQSIVDQVLAGQQQINLGQQQTNNLLLEMLKEIRRDMRWRDRGGKSYSGSRNESPDILE